MSYVVLERNYRQPLRSHLAYEDWMAVNRRLDHCLEVRDVRWLESFVSSDRRRSICVFKQTYAEAIRQACRESDMSFERVWRANLWSAENHDYLHACAYPILAEVLYQPPMDADTWKMLEQTAGPCCYELGIQGLGSFMAVDGSHSVCLFNATSAELVRSMFRQMGYSFERIWRSQLIIPQEAG